jgi:hypothetical protein
MHLPTSRRVAVPGEPAATQNRPAGGKNPLFRCGSYLAPLQLAWN